MAQWAKMHTRPAWALREYQSIWKSENISVDSSLRDDYKSGILPRINLRQLTKIQVALYILWNQRNGVIMGWMMTRGVKNHHWKHCFMIQYVRFTRYKYGRCCHRWIPFDSSLDLLYRKREDLYISITEQLPSIQSDV